MVLLLLVILALNNLKLNFSPAEINSMVRYSIQKDSYNATDYFHIDAEDGSIFLRRPLDHETHPYHHFIVTATDMGVPPLSSTAHVWLSGKE